MKLSHQFDSEGTGGKRISDQVGAGSEDWDEKAKALIPKSVRQRAGASVLDMLSRKVSIDSKSDYMGASRPELADEEPHQRNRKLFDGLVFYVNGSTYPLIGDHVLKCLLAENGAKLSLHVARRQITHVIIGTPSGKQKGGAGGGISASKIDKEIKRVGGRGVKYIGVEWILESVKAGKRITETPFASLKLAHSRQPSVHALFQGVHSTKLKTDHVGEEG